jgi:hypothetical protein
MCGGEDCIHSYMFDVTCDYFPTKVMWLPINSGSVDCFLHMYDDDPVT